MDAEYLAIGSAADPNGFDVFQPALTLLTTVVSVNHPGWVTVDAGLKTMYQHGGTPFTLGAFEGYGYEWFGDEYGKIVVPAGTAPPPLGAKIELVVSHCDPTVNQFDFFYILENGRVLDRWACDLRGMSQ
jgi:D-serine deaminase-like pyridoxal phosphate-dependent protein